MLKATKGDIYNNFDRNLFVVAFQSNKNDDAILSYIRNF